MQSIHIILIAIASSHGFNVYYELLDAEQAGNSAALLRNPAERGGHNGEAFERISGGGLDRFNNEPTVEDGKTDEDDNESMKLMVRLKKLSRFTGK